MPFPVYNYDTEQARASMRKLAELEPAAAWPGHAKPLTGDVRGAAAARRRRARLAWASARAAAQPARRSAAARGRAPETDYADAGRATCCRCAAR